MGSWATVETNITGADIANRKIFYNGTPTNLHLSLQLEREPLFFNSVAQCCFAQQAISVASSTDKSHLVCRLLPYGYYQKYPVVYMLDGQNLFDAALAYAGEWKVDESLDQWHQNEQMDFIVVGICQWKSQRLNEYSPGQSSIRRRRRCTVFAIHHRRTKSLPSIILGQKQRQVQPLQVAAWVACLALCRLSKADVFSKIGAFFFSFWFSPMVFTWIAQQPLGTLNNKVYLTAGTAEGKHSRLPTC